MIRWSTLGLLFGLLAAGVLYDRVDFAPEPDGFPVQDRVLTPALAEPAPLSNVWFCPVGSGDVGGYATHEVAISNIGTEPAIANVDLITESGPGPGLRFEIAPRSTEVVDLAALDGSANLGAVIEVVDGVGVVGHSVMTAQGVTQGPCATEASESWYFADGVTTRDSVEYLALLNPFPEDVVFDVTFQAASRTVVPQALQSAVVPAQSVRVLNVGDFVTRTDHIATSIQTIQGQLVVERLQVFDGTLGPRGAALQLGVADPAGQWSFPAGRVHEGGDHRVVIFNPTSDQAEVDLEFELDPADRASYGLVPIEATVLPGRFVVLDLAQTLAGYGLPLPYDFGLSVRSANGVPVVVERWQVNPRIDTSLIGAGGAEARIGTSFNGAFGFAASMTMRQDGQTEEVPEEDLPPATPVASTQPSASVGVASSRGVEINALSWVIPWVSFEVGEQPIGTDSTMVIATGAEGTLVEIRVVVAGELLPPVRASIPGSGYVAVPVEAAVAGAPLLITADQPVNVELQTVVADTSLAVIAAVPVIDASEGS